MAQSVILEEDRGVRTRARKATRKTRMTARVKSPTRRVCGLEISAQNRAVTVIDHQKRRMKQPSQVRHHRSPRTDLGLQKTPCCQPPSAPSTHAALCPPPLPQRRTPVEHSPSHAYIAGPRHHRHRRLWRPGDPASRHPSPRRLCLRPSHPELGAEFLPQPANYGDQAVFEGECVCACICA